MNVIVALVAVVGLFFLGFLGGVPGMGWVFGVVIPYMATVLFLGGLIHRVMSWANSDVPFRIPTTCGQQKSLDWIKQDKLDNPHTTLQVIGRSQTPVPDRIAVDSGVVDIFITDRGMRIDFRGGGLRTDVGRRDASTTTGMSVNEGEGLGDFLDDSEETPPDNRRSPRRRPPATRRVPRRRGRGDDNTTGLRGLRS